MAAEGSRVWVQAEHYKIVGACLAAARRRANVTQDELAARLGKPQSDACDHRDACSMSGEIGRTDIGQIARMRSSLCTSSCLTLRIPPRFVSECERGQRRVDVVELLVISQTLEVDPLELFGEIARSAG